MRQDLTLFFFFLCSSLSDSNEAVKALTYGDVGEDLNTFCSKLVPILERLEVLREVFIIITVTWDINFTIMLINK